MQKKLKPGLVASYDILRGNGVKLFWENGKGWKSKKIDEASKKEKGKVKGQFRCGLKILLFQHAYSL